MTHISADRNHYFPLRSVADKDRTLRYFASELVREFRDASRTEPFYIFYDYLSTWMKVTGIEDVNEDAPKYGYTVTLTNGTIQVECHVKFAQLVQFTTSDMLND